MPIIKPITDLRNTNEISDLCREKQEPIFITKNGAGDMVIMNIELYDKLFNDIYLGYMIDKIEEEDEFYDFKEAMNEFKLKHFGKI